MLTVSASSPPLFLISEPLPISALNSSSVSKLHTALFSNVVFSRSPLASTNFLKVFGSGSRAVIEW